MTKTLLVSVLLFLLSAPALASVDTAWVRRYNGPWDDYDAATAIAVDGFGNVYVTGYRAGFAAAPDYATIKYGPDGTCEWVNRYDGPGNGWDEACAIVVDAYGNAYVTGASVGSSGIMDYATLKYDSLGYWRFVKRYDGPAGGQDAAQAMTIDDSGCVYVTGYSQGEGTDYDYATIKYLPSGVVAWVARYDGPGNGVDWAYDVAVDPSGFVYVAGTSAGVGTDMDCAVIKYHPNGDTVWVRRYNGPANRGDKAKAIAVDVLGNVLVAGQSYDTTSDYDYVTLKYYQDGDTAWVRRYSSPGDGPDEPYDVATDANGRVYVTGGFGESGG